MLQKQRCTGKARQDYKCRYGNRLLHDGRKNRFECFDVCQQEGLALRNHPLNTVNTHAILP